MHLKAEYGKLIFGWEIKSYAIQQEATLDDLTENSSNLVGNEDTTKTGWLVTFTAVGESANQAIFVGDDGYFSISCGGDVVVSTYGIDPLAE